MSITNENEIAKNALIDIAKIIMESENKIGITNFDNGLCELLNEISDKFDTSELGFDIIKKLEDSTIHTNCVGEIIFIGDYGFRKCRRETSCHNLNEVVKHTAKKNNCAKDAFFSEFFKREIDCKVNG